MKFKIPFKYINGFFDKTIREGKGKIATAQEGNRQEGGANVSLGRRGIGFLEW